MTAVVMFYKNFTARDLETKDVQQTGNCYKGSTGSIKIIMKHNLFNFNKSDPMDKLVIISQIFKYLVQQEGNQNDKERITYSKHFESILDAYDLMVIKTIKNVLQILVIKYCCLLC